jgi:hypothetical protein
MHFAPVNRVGVGFRKFIINLSEVVNQKTKKGFLVFGSGFICVHPPLSAFAKKGFPMVDLIMELWKHR